MQWLSCSCVLLLCIWGRALWGERLFPLHFFSVLCPVRFPIPETIRNSPNSLYVQVFLRIEHHVRSLNVFTFLFNIHCLARCLHCNSFAISYHALYWQYNEWTICKGFPLLHNKCIACCDLNTVLVCICSFWGLVWGSFFLCFFRYDKSLELCRARMWPGLEWHPFQSGYWRQISWIHQILMLERRKFSTLEGSLILNGLSCPHCSWKRKQLAILTVEIALLCFLNKILLW